MFLSKRGYWLVEHSAAQAMDKTILTLRDGSSAGRVLIHMPLAETDTKSESR